MRSCGRPGGLWSEMMGLRCDGLQVFLLMESIHCKRLLYPVLMGSFHSEGTMTLPCFNTLFLSAPHLVTCKWHQTQTSLLPSTFYRVSYEFICWGAQLRKVQAKGVLWLPRVSWGSTSVYLTALASPSLLSGVPAAQGNSTLATAVLPSQALTLFRHPSFTPTLAVPSTQGYFIYPGVGPDHGGSPLSEPLPDRYH